VAGDGVAGREVQPKKKQVWPCGPVRETFALIGTFSGRPLSLFY
jgi:hypothetical protein